MNYKLLGIMLVTTVMVSGCMSGSKDVVSQETLDTTAESVAIETPTLEDCIIATEQYLATTSEMTKGEQTVQQGNTIVVDYIGKLEDGSVFDTSVESVAKACGLYRSDKNYTQGLGFTAGAGKMIPGFDAGVIDMAVNETKTITIPSDQAYGDATVSYPISELPTKPDNTAYVAGESIMTMNGPVEILSIDDEDFTIANTHPLAGKDLIFDITIKSIQ